MLETRAVVIQIDGQCALVKANQGNGCGQCNGEGCGAGKLSRLFCSKPRQFQVDNPIRANVGDEVIVSVADGAVMRGIGLVYALPLLLLMMGALLGDIFALSPAQGDVYATVGALCGLASGFIIARLVTLRSSGRHSSPFIARHWHKE